MGFSIINQLFWGTSILRTPQCWFFNRMPYTLKAPCLSESGSPRRSPKGVTPRGSRLPPLTGPSRPGNINQTTFQQPLKSKSWKSGNTSILRQWPKKTSCKSSCIASWKNMFLSHPGKICFYRILEKYVSIFLRGFQKNDLEKKGYINQDTGILMGYHGNINGDRFQ